MALVSRSTLRSFASNVPTYEQSRLLSSARNKTATTQATVFLSHSHDDKELVEPAILLLAGQGVLVYVDWKDPSMPKVTSPETAARLKARIKACRKFVMLATDNALNSRWVPWELGVADSETAQHVAVFPVTEASGAWSGNEYLGIYSRIENIQYLGWRVIAPGQASGESLADWLRR